jgi:hypothetical protein
MVRALVRWTTSNKYHWFRDLEEEKEISEHKFKKKEPKGKRE